MTADVLVWVPGFASRDWLESDDPEAMTELLRSLPEGGRPSARRMRLASCAIGRRALPTALGDAARRAVEAGEALADGLVGPRECQAAYEAAAVESSAGGNTTSLAKLCSLAAATCALWVQRAAPSITGHFAAYCLAPDARLAERRTQAAILRDVLGDPFAPPPFRPERVTPDAAALAEAAYQTRLMPSGELDPQRLGVLADALEEAGADGVVLAHLRGPGTHHRGCWAIDLLTGRE